MYRKQYNFGQEGASATVRFSAVTLGCKANQYDTGTIVQTLLARGHEQAAAGNGCDVCIINTCAVTAESVRKSKQAVRRMKRLAPDAVIAVCGCFSQLERETAAALGADIIGGTNDRESFAKEIETLAIRKNEAIANEAIANEAIANEAGANGTPCSHTHAQNKHSQNTHAHPPRIHQPRTRAYLKIQDGCDNRCSYCIIPQARGNSRSVSLPEITQQAATLEAQGYKEIVVTGIEISSFAPDLIQAVQAVSTAAPGVRIRLGSLTPDILTTGFTQQMQAIPGLCNHFHISVQSGCDETLKRMNRRYSTQDVCSAIAGLRGVFGNCGITADLIVGFPGETDDEFEQTLEFIEKAKFSAMHIFPYSKRPGTTAAVMPEQIAQHIKTERAKRAANVAATLSREFKHAQIGKTLDVLTETYRPLYKENRANEATKANEITEVNKTSETIKATETNKATKANKVTGGKKYSIGHSGNYLSVAIDDKLPKNTLVNVKIAGMDNGILVGEVI